MGRMRIAQQPSLSETSFSSWPGFQENPAEAGDVWGRALAATAVVARTAIRAADVIAPVFAAELTYIMTEGFGNRHHHQGVGVGRSLVPTNQGRWE